MRRWLIPSIFTLAACGSDSVEVTSADTVVTGVEVTRSGAEIRVEAIRVSTDGASRTFQATELANVVVEGYASSSIAHHSALVSSAGGTAPASGLRAAALEDLRLDTGLHNPGRARGLRVRFVLGGVPTAITNREGADLFLFEAGPPAGELGSGGFRAPRGDPFTLRGLPGNPDRSADIASGAYAQVEADGFLAGVRRWSNVSAAEDAQPIATLADLESASLQSLGSVDLTLFAVAIDLSEMGFGEEESVQGFEILRAEGLQAVDPVLILGLPDTVPR